MSSVGEELPKEMTRVRDVVLPAYLEIGTAGMFGVIMIRQSLDKAQKAMVEGDVVEMIRSLEDLREWHS